MTGLFEAIVWVGLSHFHEFVKEQVATRRVDYVPLMLNRGKS